MSRPPRSTKPPTRIFLLTCWQEEGAAEWRFRVEESGGSEQRGFADLAAVVAFLEASLQESRGSKRGLFRT